MNKTINIGAIAEVSTISKEEDMASYLGKETEGRFPEVYATSKMIALMEFAAAEIMKPLLAEGELSVGVGVNITHLAATPIATKVIAKATFLGMAGKLHRFKVECFDTGGLVGKGEHTRAIIEFDRLVASSKKRVQEEYIYHCVHPAYWAKFADKATYFPEQFEEEGFIHLCRADQMEHVRTNYFVGIPEITVLKVDVNKLTAPLKIEAAKGQTFPHIYGGLNKDAIIEISTVKNE